MKLNTTKTRIAAAILIIGAVVAVAVLTTAYLKDRGAAEHGTVPDVDPDELAILLAEIGRAHV